MGTLTAVALAAFLSGQTLDVATSCYAFSHGYHETNRLTGTKGSCPVIAAETAAISAATVLAVNHWVKTPWKRQLIYTIGAAIEFKAVIHNTHELRK